MFRSVVLPLPEGPTTATTPPRSTVNETSSRALTVSDLVAYAFVTDPKSTMFDTSSAFMFSANQLTHPLTGYLAT